MKSLLLFVVFLGFSVPSIAAEALNTYPDEEISHVKETPDRHKAYDIEGQRMWLAARFPCDNLPISPYQSTQLVDTELLCSRSSYEVAVAMN